MVVLVVALITTACDFLPEPPGQEDDLPPERPRLGPILPVITTTVPPPPESPSVAAAPTTTTVSGLSAEDLRVRDVPPLEGQPPPVFIRDLDDGGTVLRGRVTDASGGPVGGATVRLERVTIHTEQRMQTSTNDDGYWQVRSLSGGRYRIRAGANPTLPRPSRAQSSWRTVERPMWTSRSINRPASICAWSTSRPPPIR